MSSNILTMTALNGGVVSDKVYSRNDADNYSSLSKTLENMLPQTQGGICSRDGFNYVSEVKNSADLVRLIPFVFSQDDAYVLELGDLYIRFYKDNSQILDADKTITAITKANPGQVTSVAHGLTTGDQVILSDIVGMTELNGRRFTITVVDPDNFTIGINTSSYTTYTSGGTINEVYTLTSPYTDAQIWDVDFTQSGNTMIFVHPDVVPQQLVRTTDTNWTISEFVLRGGIFLDENTTATTIDPSAATGSVTVTASTSIFAATDVGRLIRFWDTAAYHILQITAYTSATEVTATFQTTAAGHVATTKWALGAYSGTTGYPETVTFHDQRLYLGATEYQQDSIAASALGDIDNFAVGTGDADAFYVTVSSSEYNRIRAMVSADTGIYIVTTGNLSVLASSDSSLGITPTTVKVSWLSKDGGSNVKPCKSGRSILYNSRTTRKVTELYYQPDSGYSISNLANLAEHLTNKGISDFAYQEEPNSVIWMSTEDGSLLSLTHNRNLKISSWASHSLGRNATATFVHSITTIPTADEDQLWMAVERVVDGVTKIYVEYMSPHFFAEYDYRVQDAKYLDCALSFTGTTPAATLTPAAITGSGITFTAGSSVFTANDVGKTIRTTYSNADGTFTYSKGLIVTYSSGTSITVDIQEDFVNTSAIASGRWTLSSDTFSGAWHLEGETVQVFADGGTHEDVTIEDGSFTLGDQYTNVIIGYGYTQKYTSLDLNTVLPQGKGIGSKNRITEVMLSVARTVAGSIGRDDTRYENIVDVPTFDEATPIYTGKKFLEIEHGYQEECAFSIKQTLPLPLNVTGCVLKCEVNSGV